MKRFLYLVFTWYKSFLFVFNHVVPFPNFSSLQLNGQRTRALNFDMMKKRLDRGLYTRLDTFQHDFLSIFNRARKLSTNNARIYQDAVTLEQEYIKVR